MDMIFNKALNDESQLIRNKARQILPCSNTNYKKIILLIFLFLIVITAEYHILKKNEKPKNLALNMKHAVALKRLGDVFIEKKSSSDDEKKKNYSQAEKYFTSALEKIESYPDAWVMLANIKYKARDFNKALEYAQNAEKYADNNWDNYKDMRHETYLLMGNLYTLKRDFKKAREMYLKSLELKPSYQPAETGLKQIEKYIDFYLNKTR
jgi:tetratricopeptide (TPR) repeat protein